MRDPEQFDAFYRDTRDRLLLQTYALTGDLPAARSAVRDGYVVAWHHWRKACHDPEAYTRRLAWNHAQRRHTARIWHREKGLDPEVQATLEALSRLSSDQRRMLILTVLATGTIDDFAREMGLTREAAERELQTATAQLAILRDVPAPLVRTLFPPLAELVADVRLPRATILRRAGAARRRAHTTVGAVAAVAALAASGVLVTDPAGVRASLDRQGVSAAGPASHTPLADRSQPPEPAPTPDPVLEGGQLLEGRQLAALDRGRWRETATHDNTAGRGLVVPCQRDRYADPRGKVAFVRTFVNGGRRPDRVRSMTQIAEASRSESRAEKAYRTATGWFAGCSEPRTQLLSTRRVGRVGNEAVVLVLRDWDAPVTTMVAGVARTGALTTATVASARGTAGPAVRGAVRVLGAAVRRLCSLPDAGRCPPGPPRVEVARPLPVGKAPGMLSEVDLPPVSGVTRRWVGTDPRRAVDNYAATRCDRAQFRGEGWSHNLTRTFLIPGSRLPAQFGITQTVGSLPVQRARAFVAEVRDDMADCARDDLGTEVEQVADQGGKDSELVAWRVTTELSDDASVQFLMALARTGPRLTQIGFVPSGGVSLDDGVFVAVAERARDRLPALPPPRR